MIDERKALAFLALDRLAVVGASDDERQFGNVVLRALRDHGIDAAAVHPTARTVAGAEAHPDLASVPGRVDGVIVMVPAAHAVEVVRDCARLGIGHVWLFKGLGGAGALSDEAVAECERHGIEVVAGACPLMFLEPVGFVHRIHRGARRLNRSLTRAAA